jgi:hypothetical protein
MWYNSLWLNTIKFGNPILSSGSGSSRRKEKRFFEKPPDLSRRLGKLTRFTKTKNTIKEKTYEKV